MALLKTKYENYYNSVDNNSGILFYNKLHDNVFIFNLR